MVFKSKFTVGMFQQTSMLDGDNAAYIESLYAAYLANPAAVSKEWQQLFSGLPEGTAPASTPSSPRLSVVPLPTPLSEQAVPLTQSGPIAVLTTTSADDHTYRWTLWVNAYRHFGYRVAKSNPLAPPPALNLPELQLKTYGLSEPTGETLLSIPEFKAGKSLPFKVIQESLRATYCGSIGSEFSHISDTQERVFLQTRLEALCDHPIPVPLKKQLLETLLRAEGLERYLGAKYPGAKRFSLEGSDSLMIALEHLIQLLGNQGAKEVAIGMTHRGRLNVLVNLLGKNPAQLFDVFEGKDQEEQRSSGDVKYHEGFSSDVTTPGGTVHISLAFNPSHLEIVCPVVCGSVKARQDRRATGVSNEVVPILIHGDAAFAGQGVVMETLNMSQTRGYGVGGSIHIIVNNQIGFTTSDPKDARSTPYCSDLGKMFQLPIFHVNGDDPEAVYRVVCLAAEYRSQYHKDVIIDLIGYRRHGHNEADEPAATQPTMYQQIRSKPTVSNAYADNLLEKGFIQPKEIEDMQSTYRSLLDSRKTIVAPNVIVQTEQGYALKWKPYVEGRLKLTNHIDTRVERDTLKNLAQHLDQLPDGWITHPRVQKILFDRTQMTAEKMPIDWGYAEILAYASLLNEKYSVRLSGQDSGRGTFFHRHAVLHHLKTGETLIPLMQFAKLPARMTVIDSLLSEMAVMGFEYGYACTDPDVLVIWEAQFGDFANGAQVVIDQFISSGERKWGRLCGLTLFLPHGYEGQGPEHSSARLERYLQLCAQHNMQVCVPSAPAQIFHLLRRQMHNKTRLPLIVMTPKSLLRHKMAVSTFDELVNGSFQRVISDTAIQDPNTVERVVLCSGKVYYDLLTALTGAFDRQNIALIRIEQLYPFPETLLKVALESFTRAKTVIWCQEEPRNQGAWYFVKRYIRSALLLGQTLSYIGRKPAAASAVGSHTLHEKQQAWLVQAALGRVNGETQ
jgi:2-oxoglutarate dehydrogenase E1 component